MTFPSWAGGKRARIAKAVLAAIFTILVATYVGPLLTSVWAQTPVGTSQEPSTSIGQKAASHMQPRPTTVLGWHLKIFEHWPPDPDLNDCHLKFNRAHFTTSSIVNLTITDRRGAPHSHSSWSIFTLNDTAWSPISKRTEIHSIPTVSGMRRRLKIRSTPNTSAYSLFDRFSPLSTNFSLYVFLSQPSLLRRGNTILLVFFPTASFHHSRRSPDFWNSAFTSTSPPHLQLLQPKFTSLSNMDAATQHRQALQALRATVFPPLPPTKHCRSIRIRLPALPGKRGRGAVRSVVTELRFRFNLVISPTAITHFLAETAWDDTPFRSDRFQSCAAASRNWFNLELPLDPSCFPDTLQAPQVFHFTIDEATFSRPIARADSSGRVAVGEDTQGSL